MHEIYVFPLTRLESMTSFLFFFLLCRCQFRCVRVFRRRCFGVRQRNSSTSPSLWESCNSNVICSRAVHCSDAFNESNCNEKSQLVMTCRNTRASTLRNYPVQALEKKKPTGKTYKLTGKVSKSVKRMRNVSFSQHRSKLQTNNSNRNSNFN